MPLRHLCRLVLLRFNPPLCPLWLQWKALGPLVGQLSWRSRMLLTVLMLCASLSVPKVCGRLQLRSRPTLTVVLAFHLQPRLLPCHLPRGRGSCRVGD